MIELKHDLQSTVLPSQNIRCSALLNDRSRRMPLEPERPADPHQKMVLVERPFFDAAYLCGTQADRSEERPPLRDDFQEVVSLDRLDRGRASEHERLTVCCREERGIPPKPRRWCTPRATPSRRYLPQPYHILSGPGAS